MDERVFSAPGRLRAVGAIEALLDGSPARARGASIRDPTGGGLGEYGSGEAAGSLLRAAFDSTRSGLVILDRDRTVRLVNRAAADMLKTPPVTADAPPTLLQFLRTSPLLDAAALRMFAASLVMDEPCGETTLSLPGPSGMRILTVELRRASTLGWAISLQDVTETQLSRDWLLEHASSDPVTGLWTMQHFMLMVRDWLDLGGTDDGGRDGGRGNAILTVGLRQFRSISDSLGNVAGDALLRLVGGRLNGCLGSDDMIARIAGEEFAVALASRPDATPILETCEKLIETLSRPYMVEGEFVSLSASIGVALTHQDGDTAECLLANATMALNAAEFDRGSGGFGSCGGVRFFTPELTQLAQRRRSLEADLRLALSAGEFELHYQPQVDLGRGRVTGLEALVRWRNAARGLVPPAEFIPFAEDHGLICLIGEWVLHEACREAMTWPDDIVVAVNASPTQFDTGNFDRAVALALKATGLAPERLEIEITESLLLGESSTVLETVNGLQAMGVRLALDDFGTGYASLRQLGRIHFDSIKIDRSFVSGPGTNADNSAIVHSIAALGRSLGIPTIAEGVETQAQLDQIRAHGCTSVQGYYFSKPVRAGDVFAVIARLNHAGRMQDADLDA